MARWYYLCHRSRRQADPNPEVPDTGIALTTLEDGQTRTIQFRVDNWNQERDSIRDTVARCGRLAHDVRNLRPMENQEGHGATRKAKTNKLRLWLAWTIWHQHTNHTHTQDRWNEAEELELYEPQGEKQWKDS